jgi:hypothetical protein
VQIDSPSGLPPALAMLVAKMRNHFEADNEYGKAISKSPFIQGLRVTTGHEIEHSKNDCQG